MNLYIFLSAKVKLTINSLEDSLLLVVFNALPSVKDIARAACVSKRWQRILGAVRFQFFLLFGIWYRALDCDVAQSKLVHASTTKSGT